MAETTSQTLNANNGKILSKIDICYNNHNLLFNNNTLAIFRGLSLSLSNNFYVEDSSRQLRNDCGTSSRMSSEINLCAIESITLPMAHVDVTDNPSTSAAYLDEAHLVEPQTIPLEGTCTSLLQIATQDNLITSASNTNLWDPISVKLSPESMSPREGKFNDGEFEEITFKTELSDSSTRVKDHIDNHQTSEEAFGAYIAARLMEFPPEIRQIKKAKLFKHLEEPEDVP